MASFVSSTSTLPISGPARTLIARSIHGASGYHERFFCPRVTRGVYSIHERGNRSGDSALRGVRRTGIGVAARPLLGLLHQVGRIPSGGQGRRLRDLPRTPPQRASPGRVADEEPRPLPQLCRPHRPDGQHPHFHQRHPPGAGPRTKGWRSPRRRLRSAHLPARASRGRAACPAARRRRRQHRSAHPAARFRGDRHRAGRGRHRIGRADPGAGAKSAASAGRRRRRCPKV